MAGSAAPSSSAVPLGAKGVADATPAGRGLLVTIEKARKLTPPR